MQIVKRIVEEIDKEDHELLYLGYNSNNVLSFVFKDMVINFHGSELNKIKEFLNNLE